MPADWSRQGDVVRLFVAGDVMTGRAIDQLFETHNGDDFGKPDAIPASRYSEWSAALNGREALPVGHDYIWGTALETLRDARPDFRLANLETSVTTSSAWDDKEFNFRMHPANAGCLTALGLDCVALANNHVLDFGIEGLRETLQVLKAAKIGYCGAGEDGAEASRPHVHELPDGKRILVFSWGFADSGVPAHWRAGPDAPGLQQIEEFDTASARRMTETIACHRREDDLVIASIHWGANWVERIPVRHRSLARHLIDHAGVDAIHGHSSHHVLPAEQYKGKPIFYGCGDLINDAEGRPDRRALNCHLRAMFFADIDKRTHRLAKLRVVPVERRRFRLEEPPGQDSEWVLAQLRGA